MYILNGCLRKEYTEKHKEIARVEAKVYRLSELLGVQRSNTIENVQRKQALTPGEREQEEEADVIDDEEEDDEEEGTIYNPKNLPLGWDGKVRIQLLLSLTYFCFNIDGIISLFNFYSQYLIGYTSCMA